MNFVSANQQEIVRLTEFFCLRDDLSTSDPYDIWKTGIGHYLKQKFYFHRRLFLPAVGLCSLYDFYLNNRRRLGYRKQEFPIVRGMAALALLKLYSVHPQERYLQSAEAHLRWLLKNHSTGYKGIGWGLGFASQINQTIYHEANTPYSTMTPYCTEALVAFHEYRKEDWLKEAITGCLRFFLEDLKVVYEDEKWLCTSYVPLFDRTVYNATSYTMYMYALLSSWGSAEQQIEMQRRMKKIRSFILDNQNADGSWLYAYNDSNTFIDCFHSCFVMKNLWKTARIFPSPESDQAIMRGYDYIKRELWDETSHLFRRFSKANKPGIIKFDLYDNAEALNLALLLGDYVFAEKLHNSIKRNFFKSEDRIYSAIDIFGIRHNLNFLRWAVMPFVLAGSGFLVKEGK